MAKMKLPKIRSVYEKIMNITAEYYGNPEYSDPFIFMCNLVGIDIKDIGELNRSKLNEVATLKMIIGKLNEQDKKPLDVEELQEVNDKLDKIYTFLLKVVEDEDYRNRLYDGKRCVIKTIDIVINSINDKVLDGDYFKGFWTKAFPKEEIVETETTDLGYLREVITIKDNFVITLKNPTKPREMEKLQLGSVKEVEAMQRKSRDKKFKKLLQEILANVKPEDIRWAVVRRVSDEEYEGLRALREYAIGGKEHGCKVYRYRGVKNLAVKESHLC